MLIKQLSVFLENKMGRINELTTILGESGINLSAFSMTENAEFGILRVIVSDPDRALTILREHKFGVTLTDVVCLQSPNIPGALAKALDYLTEGGVSIEYMYAFATGENAFVVIRPNDTNRCIEVLQQHKLALIAANQFYQL